MTAPSPYPSLRRPLLAIVLGCVVGIAAGLAAGFYAGSQLDDSGVPTKSGNELVALLLAVLNAVLTAISYSISFLVPALNWFAGVWAACVALALAVDCCQPQQRSVPKMTALALLVLLSGLGLVAVAVWARGYDADHPAQVLVTIAPALACSAALLVALPVLVIGHFVGRRRARRAMPTHAAAGA